MCILPTLIAGDRTLSESEQRGRQLYFSGTVPPPGVITARIGDYGPKLPGALQPCALCHGTEGEGGASESGVAPSEITWTSLTRPYVVTSLSGRSHPKYTEQTLRRAVTMGFDSAGNKLNLGMPIYEMPYRSMEDLVAFIKTLSSGHAATVAPDVLSVGVILPPASSAKGAADAMRAAAQAFFDSVNRNGGIYRRRIELKFIALPDSPPQAAAAIGQFIQKERIFTCLADSLAESGETLSALFADKGVPVIAAFPLLNPEHPNAFVFYIQQGLQGEVEALVRYAVERLGRGKRAAILYPDQAPVLASLAEAAERVWNRAGESPLTRLRASDPKLLPNSTDILFSLVPDWDGALLQQHPDWHPALLMPGSLAGKAIFDYAAGTRASVLFGFGSSPADRSEQARVQYH